MHVLPPMSRVDAVRILGCFIFLIILIGCDREGEKPLLRLKSPEETGITFRNQLFENDRLNIITWEYFYNGGGVGMGDFDNDGLPDLFFSANMVNSALYVNKGALEFEDITERAGIQTQGQWVSGVSLVDINSDGWLDIYLSIGGPYPAHQRRNKLYINQGDLTFVEQAEKYGLADSGHTTQAVFFDYDRDGDLDCYLLTNMMDKIGPNVIRPKKKSGTAISNDRLYRNDNQVFTNVSKEAGILIEGYGLGVSVCDFNQDHWPDLYVSNDFLSNDLVWVNQKDGTFQDEAATYFRHTSYSAMGHDVGDINADGLADIVTVDMLPATHQRQKRMFGASNYDRFQMELKAGYHPQYMRNTLQLHQGFTAEGKPLFAEVGQMLNIHQTDWSWSALLGDITLSGWPDLLITNGYPRDITNRDFADYKAGVLFGNQQAVDLGGLAQKLAQIEGIYVPNYVFENQEVEGWVNRSQEWGFTQPSYSHGMALGDLDGDGDLEVVVNNLEDSPFIYENFASDRALGNWLQLSFQGPLKNKMGLGVEVEAWAGAHYQKVTYYPVHGYLSSQAVGITLGLGKSTLVDSLRIRWPDDKEEVRHEISVNQRLQFSWENAHPMVHPAVNGSIAPLWVAGEEVFTPSYLHLDEDYPDFKVQPLLPHKHSNQGPKMAVGDSNGDGLDDFFIGGGAQQSGYIYTQQRDGTFSGMRLAEDTPKADDMGCVWLDVEGDQDLDLYIVRGGSEFPEGHPAYCDRLYRNEGNGRFSLDKEALPDLNTSGSCVVALDYDRDGDEDLFIGGRLTPHAYPKEAPSYLLQNVGGKFERVEGKSTAAFESLSMVSDAIAKDMNGDGWPDLVTVGEWMPIQLFLNEQGTFNQPITIPQSNGWWNTLAVADFDQDGDQDLMVGNRGLNSRLKTSVEKPVRLYYKDFNGDGTPDGIMTHFLEGVEVPFHSRDDLIQQINEFRSLFPTYESFASSDWRTLLPEEQKEGMQVKEVHTFASCYVENVQNSDWKITPLPQETQVAPIQSMLASDFDGDGYLDVLLSGNTQGTEVQTGAYDAFNGLWLRGNGQGDFTVIPMQQSGIFIPGEGRDLAMVHLGKGQRPLILASQHKGKLLGFFYSRESNLQRKQEGL